MIDLQTAQQLLSQARQFYKHGLKSSNKMYTDVSTSRKLARNQNSPVADAEIARHRYRLLQLGYDQFGQYLMKNQITAGNCTEMTAVGAHIAASRFPDLDFEVVGPRDLDHALIIVAGESNAVPADGDPNFTLEAIAGGAYGADLWIIDVWLNIGCEAADYSTQAIAKLEGWDQQGKTIAGGSAVNADGIPMPTATIDFRQWWTQLVTQPLKYLEQ